MQQVSKTSSTAVAVESQSGAVHIPARAYESFFTSLFSLRFSDMSIVHRLYLSVGITFVLFLSSFVVISYLMQQHISDFERIELEVQTLSDHNTKLKESLFTLATAKAEGVNDVVRATQTQVNQLQKVISELDNQEIVLSLKGNDLVSLREATATLATAKTEAAREEALAQALRQSVDLERKFNAYLMAQEHQSLTMMHKAEIAFALGLIVSFIVILLCNYSIRKSLRQDTGSLLHCLKRMSQGDLREKVELKAKDEIGCIGNLVDHVVDNTNQTLNIVKNDVEKLYDMVNANSQSISATNEAISVQRNTAQSVSNATAEMESAVSQVADYAKSTLKEVKSAEQASDMCRCTMQDNITTTHTLSDRLHASSEAINKIHMMSSQIESIVKTIADIADQTNLLALNATIESARAGASGKGFAIVADEIRDLAIKTARSTKEVSQTINLLEEAVTNSVQVMASCEGEMDNSLQQSSRANSSIEEIMGFIAIISDMSEQIVQSCQQQSRAAGEINMSIAHISRLAEDSYDQMAGLQSNMTALHELATNQTAVLDKFQIPQDRA